MENTKKSIKTLELSEILTRLAALAVTEDGKARCCALEPTHDLETATAWQAQTAAARRFCETKGSPPLRGIRDITAAIRRTDKGGALNTRELLDIAALLNNTRALLRYADEKHETPALQSFFARLVPARALEDAITDAIPGENEVADTASSELATIRRHIRNTGARVKDTLQRYLSGSFSKYLQDVLITQRNGRSVVPVKIEHKGDIPGLVHDVSSSGATLFVEPFPVVNLGNELREWESKERKEIDRILAALSAGCGENRDIILENYAVVVELDVIFARAKLSSDQNANPPLLNDEGRWELIEARHPLLNQSTCVPTTLTLGKTFDTLVITGPNTGGKTVTLKTIGLLTLMAKCGLQIPAGNGSEVSIAGEIYADIGDEQSIAQSLSTFSAHMTNIVAILDKIALYDLVLFDELGAGTDPVEGAALAVSIIEHARARGARIAATTHYAELKTYALSSVGVENAGCEFNIETLRPTYRLLIGIPGKSNAFAISRRLGLPEQIVVAATGQIDASQRTFEEVLGHLEAQRSGAEEEYRAARNARAIAEREREDAETLRQKVDAAYQKAAGDAKAEARRILQNARDEADEILRELAKMRETGIENAKIADIRRKLNEAESKAETDMQRELPAAPKFERPPAVGEEVLILSTNTRGVVTDKPDKRGKFPIQAGILKISVSLDGLAPVAKTQQKKKSSGSVTVSKSNAPVKLEVNLRGMTVEEGVMTMEAAIDNAVMNKVPSLSVIHGKGTGVLRAACQQALRRNKQVASFRLGRFGEGESGVTIVELK